MNKITRLCEKCNENVDEKKYCDHLDCSFMFVNEESDPNVEILFNNIEKLHQKFAEIQKQLQEQQLRLQILEQERSNPPQKPNHDPLSPWDTPRFPDTNPFDATCPVCGIKMGGLMHYLCTRSNCPNNVRMSVSNSLGRDNNGEW